MTPAVADELSYNYLEGGYEWVDFGSDFGGADGDGWDLGGSIEIADNWHVFANFGQADLDANLGLSADYDVTAVGGGYHRTLAPNLDLVVNLSYVDVELDSGFGSADDDGFGIGVGVRMLLAEKFEVAGFLDYVDIDDLLDETTITGEGWYRFTPAFAVGAIVGIGDDVPSYGIAGRWFFDGR
jgi:hypothetical protein